MKNLILILSFIIGLFLFSSCTKVIDIDLNSSAPQVVIEGNISNNGLPAIVKITESINFDESNDFPNIEGATVTLSDNLGGIEVLAETSPGIYTSSTMTGSIGNTYFLNVEFNGELLTANSTIPNQVPFDSLTVEVNTNSSGGFGPESQTSSHNVIIQYQDPVVEVNYYRFVEYVNGIFEQSYIFDDDLSNGLLVTRDLTRSDRDLSSGDIIKIEMQSIDFRVYDYFFSFGNLFGGPSSSSTPANPNTNISGSKLGYFSAHTFETKEFIIQ